MTREEVIQGLQFTIEMFLFDPSTGETLTEPRNNLDKATIDACKGAIELLKQQPCEGMRDATEEERKSTKDYIDSISKPTGLQFDDIYEELDFVQPHKKISVNLRLCKDCISREEALKVMCDSCPMYNCVTGCSSYRHIEKMPSVTPQPKRGKWIFNENMHDYCCSECGCLMPSVNKYYRKKIIGCPYCLADMREVQDDD